MHLDGVQRIEVVERECLDRLQGRQVVQDQGVEAEKAVEGVVGDHLWGNKQISRSHCDEQQQHYQQHPQTRQKQTQELEQIKQEQQQ